MTNKLIGLIIIGIIIYTLINIPTTQFPSQLKTYDVELPNIVKVGFIIFGIYFLSQRRNK